VCGRCGERCGGEVSNGEEMRGGTPPLKKFYALI